MCIGLLVGLVYGLIILLNFQILGYFKFHLLSYLLKSVKNLKSLKKLISVQQHSGNSWHYEAVFHTWMSLSLLLAISCLLSFTQKI